MIEREKGKNKLEDCLREKEIADAKTKKYKGMFREMNGGRIGGASPRFRDLVSNNKDDNNKCLFTNL